MIVFVDVEHQRVEESPENWAKHCEWRLSAKYRFEEISGEHCLIMRYDRLSPATLAEVNAKAVLVSGNMTEFQHYDEAKLAGLRAVYRQAAQPIIGFCAGFQMMADTFGVKAEAIVADETGDMDDDSWKERTHESGFTPVQQTAYHPLFAGLDQQMTFFEEHYWEIKSLPDGFKKFASTDITPIQFMAHETLPLFGSQFHPEVHDDAHPDGRKLLENFFKFVREYERDSSFSLLQTA